MIDHGIVFEDPMSMMMVFNTISLGFMIAYSMAAIWMTANRRNTDLEALQPA